MPYCLVSINIKGSNSKEIQKLLDYLDTDNNTRYLANKIKSIDSTTNDDRISVSREMFNKLGEDAFATDDTIRATDLQPKDKAIALSDKVDVFTMADFFGMQSLLEVTVQEFKKILQEHKSSSATFTIKDTSANIQNGIMDLIANKDRLGDKGQGIDSTENNVPIDLSNLTKEQYDSIKGKFNNLEISNFVLFFNLITDNNYIRLWCYNPSSKQYSRLHISTVHTFK